MGYCVQILYGAPKTLTFTTQKLKVGYVVDGETKVMMFT